MTRIALCVRASVFSASLGDFSELSVCWESVRWNCEYQNDLMQCAETGRAFDGAQRRARAICESRLRRLN